MEEAGVTRDDLLAGVEEERKSHSQEDDKR